MFSPVEMLILADSKREMAARARRWADQLATHADQALLLQHADELEAEASDLEWRAWSQNSN